MKEVTSDDYKQYIRFKYVVENIKDVIWELDTNLLFIYISPACKEVTGYDTSEMIGKRMTDFLVPESREFVLDQWKKNEQNRKSCDSSGIMMYDLQFIRKDNGLIWVEVSVKPVFKRNKFLGYIGVTRDVTEKKVHENELKKYYNELEAANRELEKLATFDILTGAYNRRRFEEYVESAVGMKEMHGSPFSIIMFDIDCFKLINDIYGHNWGDRILQEVSEIVKASIGQEDKLFRWGGDEFIILMPGKASENAYKVAERVRKSIEKNNFGIQHDKITISTGVGEYKTGESIDQFVSRVDDALLTAKSGGRNKVILS
ncbi:MAG TPA: sensor domain-containing diguanylate cyclase [Candidatus Diapherotrites archaeon]|nr:sensor domain-containing diguanylate cyclase [Candidatus Diapherotrites archaeon]